MPPAFLILVVLLSLGLSACNRGGPTQATARRSPAPTASGPLSWKVLESAPSRRTEVSVAAIGHRIFVMGGFTLGGGSVRSVEVYDASNDSWREGPRFPIALNHAMAVSHQGVVYVFGGYRGPALANATDRAFALSGRAWEELPRMPEVRAAAGAAAVGNVIYIAGGVGPSGLASSLLKYEPETKTWTAEQRLPTPREHLGVAGFDSKLYVVGGRTGGIGTNLATSEAFDPATGSWTALPDMPTARGGSAATATTNGFVVSAGGEADATFDEVEAFDVGGGKWISLPPMPTARHGLGVIAVGARVFVIAGGPNPGFAFSDANEMIDLANLSANPG